MGRGQQEGAKRASSRTTERAIQNVFANSTNASEISHLQARSIIFEDDAGKRDWPRWPWPRPQAETETQGLGNNLDDHDP